jgi:hypothetical protein
VILTIERSGGGPPLGFLVAGLSPMLASSASYDRFHNLLAASFVAGREQRGGIPGGAKTS